MCFACCAIKHKYGVGGSKDYVLPTKLMLIQSALNLKRIASVTPIKTCYTAWHYKQDRHIWETSEVMNTTDSVTPMYAGTVRVHLNVFAKFKFFHIQVAVSISLF